MEGFQAKLEQKGIVRGKNTENAGRNMTQYSSVQSLLTRADLTRQQWVALNLEEQRRGWEEVGLQIAASQEASNVSRKNLADSTKGFRKLTDEEKLQQWGPLLKGYQAEIDALTKRSKVAESVVLNVYKLFQDVVDPSQMLESLGEELKKLMALETSNEKVVKELAEYKAEFATLKNQEVTIRNLQDQNQALQVQFQQKLEESVSNAVIEEKKRFDTELARERKDSAEKLMQADTQIRQEKALRKELQSAYDDLQAAHLSKQSAFEEQLSARDAQIALLSDEVERSGLRAASLEKEKEQINQQYLDLWKKQYGTPTEVSSNLPPSAAAKLSELETAVQSKEVQLKQVTLQVEILQETLDKERSAFTLMAQDHARQLQLKADELHNMQREMAQMPSAAEVTRLRRQLRMLQALHYNAIDKELQEDDDADMAPAGGGEGDDGGGGGHAEQRQLEEAIMNKNQQLESRLSEMRRAAEAAAAQQQELERVVASQAEALRRLEAERSTLLLAAAPAAAAGENPTNGFTTAQLSELLLRPDDNDPAAAGAGRLRVDTGLTVGDMTVPSPTGTSGGGPVGGRECGMAALEQRAERLRQLVAGLEGEKVALEKRVASLDTEVRTLRSDNVKMYEKIRFLESYRPRAGGGGAGGGGGGAGGGGACLAPMSDVELGLGDVPNVAKYREEYEESLNPFTVFTQKQRALRRDKMDLAERLLLDVSSFFLGRPMPRKFLFVYMVCMHLLVFTSLYRFTHKPSTTWCKKILAAAGGPGSGPASVGGDMAPLHGVPNAASAASIAASATPAGGSAAAAAGGMAPGALTGAGPARLLLRWSKE